MWCQCACATVLHWGQVVAASWHSGLVSWTWTAANPARKRHHVYFSSDQWLYTPHCLMSNWTRSKAALSVTDHSFHCITASGKSCGKGLGRRNKRAGCPTWFLGGVAGLSGERLASSAISSATLSCCAWSNTYSRPKHSPPLVQFS